MSQPSTQAPVIAVDGPSGSGKGTISRMLAQRLGWHFLDSGALYRVLALAAQHGGLEVEDSAALVQLAVNLDVRFASSSAGGEKILLRGEDVSAEVRSEACADAASRFAGLAPVRAALIPLQQRFRCHPGLVADGRDMGTAIFPDAIFKLFLTASPKERARRRHKQLKEKGLDANLDRLFRDIAARDVRDQSRSVSPLSPAADALILDSTALEVEAVVSRALEHINNRMV